MRDRLPAHLCQAVGSCVFLTAGLSAARPFVVVGSALFLAGTLALVGQEVRSRPRLVQEVRSRCRRRSAPEDRVGARP